MAASMMPWASAALETSPRDGDGLAAGGGDGGDDGVGAGLAGGVVDDDGGAFGGERLGDGGADAFGGAGDDCDFTCELAHDVFPLIDVCVNRQSGGMRARPFASIVRNIRTIELSVKSRYASKFMRPLFHPSIEDITVEGILHALSDPGARGDLRRHRRLRSARRTARTF